MPDNNPCEEKMKEVYNKTSALTAEMNDLSKRYDNKLFIRNIPQLMHKYQFTFKQALAWASKDVQNLLLIFNEIESSATR